MTTKQILIIVTDTFSAQKDAPCVVGFDKCFAWLQAETHLNSLLFSRYLQAAAFSPITPTIYGLHL